MKPSTVILGAIATVSLVFSIAAFALVAQNIGLFAPSNPSASPTPTWTAPPAPQPTQAPRGSTFTVNYTIASMQEISQNITSANLTVTATYQNGSDVAVNYSDFYLELSIPSQSGQSFIYNTVQPLNIGTFTLGPTHPEETVQLTFEYPTRGSNGAAIVPTTIALNYTGPASVPSIELIN